MRKNILPRALWALPVLMTCMACAVALETDYEVEKSFTKRSSLEKTFVISASVEEPADETKTQLSGTDVVWKAGDQIRIFDASHTTGVVYELQDGGDGKKSATFAGGDLAATGPYYAVYPASLDGTFNGSSVTFDIPKTQTLAAGTFGNGANIAFATVTDKADAFVFKNVLGAVKIQLTNSTTVTDVRIETKKGTELLWGTATVGMSGGVPAISSLTNEAYDKQIVTASGSATGTAFYVMVPPGALASGFVVHVMDNASKAMVKTADAATVTRSAITPMPAFEYTVQFQSAFLDLSPLPFGYFSGINPGGTPSSFVFNKSTSQFANKVESTTRTFRVQDFTAGKMYQFVAPATLELGCQYSVSVESVVGSTYTAPASTDFKLVQKTANAGWFVSSDNTKGFIISLED